MLKQPFRFVVGSVVHKTGGYKFPGVVVAAYHTLDGQARYVVECTAPEVKGMQHIFNGDQLGLDK